MTLRFEDLDIHSVMTFARALFGVLVFARLRHPADTLGYRREFLAWTIFLPLFATVGLQPWLAEPSLSSWQSYGALSQFLFNVGVVLVLLFRRRLHGPTWRGHVSERTGN